jgi:ADP-heptose:LPS heptosyltransferase
MKPKLLVVELWGLGDLLIATPFLQAASEHYAVTLLAKPYAEDLQARFWKGVTVVSFIAPWTAFQHKYRLFSWPWRQILRLRHLRSERFEVGLSGRWDPRDHVLLALLRARQRLGFPRMGSTLLLTKPLTRPDPLAHRYEHWRVVAQALGLPLPTREHLPIPPPRGDGEILLHTGAGQQVRVWPLDRYRRLAARLRQSGLSVRIACDPDQQQWWRQYSEHDLAVPHSVAELLALVDRARAFIGNDSGPGHLAAFCGVPTLTIFGPQLPEWFGPLHPAAQWMEGRPCPYKPCSDYCRFAEPCCIVSTTEEEVWERVTEFLGRNKVGI